MEDDKPKLNGTSNDAVMIIDSDEEDSPPNLSKPYKDDVIFDDRDEQYHSTGPYHSVIQHLDLPLGTDVLHLSFLDLPRTSHGQGFASIPKICAERLIVALACADSTIRILTLPLTPPSPRSKARPELRDDVSLVYAGNGTWGEQLVTIHSSTGHQNLAKGVSMTLSPYLVDGSDEMSREEENSNSGSQAELDGVQYSSHNEEQSGNVHSNSAWDLLLASYSEDLSGLLLLHRIPLLVDGSGLDVTTAELFKPWQTQYLPSAPVSVQFNPSQPQEERHSWVLVAETRGTVRIYDFMASSDSDRGPWLLSLYPGFEKSSGALSIKRCILDAQWVFGGRAILVLTADGEWGVWEIEPVGMKLKPGAEQQAITGGMPTRFAFSSWINSSDHPSTTASNMRESSNQKSKLAPMTPGTRRVRQEALFSGFAPRSSKTPRGAISVLRGGNSLSRRTDDDTVTIWYENVVVTIPSLRTYWQNKATGSGNLFNPGIQTKSLSNLGPAGERHNGVEMFSTDAQPAYTAKASSEQLDLLVTSDQSFSILTQPLLESTKSTKSQQIKARPTSIDQQLLSKGELDVLGMDRILEGMTNGNGSHLGGTGKQRVGFAR